MPNKMTVVKTNTTQDSIKEVPLKAITFDELWNNYPSGNPYADPAYTNQCAIRLSVTFHRVGIAMKSFSAKRVKPMSGAPTIGRVILEGNATATRAEELGEWLQLQPFAGCHGQKISLGETGNRRLKGAGGLFSFRGIGHAAAKARPMRAADTLTCGMVRG
ncbi:T6SS effector amidase Tae4 family protein [Paraburkholderia bryophila]|uniref:Type VI secretion system (T6SS) effector Tae4 (Amidase) n=1 Tax=Paraburkholderia bryophila TaxID=420952 RepID=A0A7Z0AZW1_9BURK|nr:hypothetical protein [Paraburkholderia bryophila]